MNLLVTIDANYIHPLRVMLCSLLCNNPEEHFSVYLAHRAMTDSQLSSITAGLDPNRLALYPIQVSDEELIGAPVEKQYPREMYYRLFAARYLPEHLDRILYLDPDLVVLGRVRPLYEIELGNCWFAAASHVHRVVQRLNELRLEIPSGGAYVNSGVLLMDLTALRDGQHIEQILDYIRENHYRMILPDQDVLNALYHDRILPLNPLIYNLSEGYLLRQNLDHRSDSIDLDWVQKNAVFVHYCGRNKPWKEGYVGVLDRFYHIYADQLDAGTVG